MTKDEGPPPPSKRTAGDVAHDLTRAVLSAIPFVGGPAEVLFASIFEKPIERRRDATLSLLMSAVATLQQHPDVDFEALRNSDDFYEFAHDVLRAAIRAHRQEKLRALQNLLVNAALPGAPGEAKARVFLRMVDELDVHHLLLMELMAAPQRFLEQRGLPFPGRGDRLIEMDAMTMHESPRSLESIVKSVLSEELPDDLRELVLQDLVRRGLTAATFSVLCGHASLLSPLGLEFVRFIANPPGSAFSRSTSA